MSRDDFEPVVCPGELPTEAMRETERFLKRQLAMLERDFRRAAEPYLRELAALNRWREPRVMMMPKGSVPSARDVVANDD